MREPLLENPKKSFNAKTIKVFKATSNLFFSAPNNEKGKSYSDEKLIDALSKTSCHMGYSGIKIL